MKEINITGQKREALGKKASKQYRKEGLVPCNIYGEKKCENGRPVAMSFVAPMSELRKLVYTPHIYVVNLIIDGESHPAIMKELQFHPVTDALLHIDFYEVKAGEKIDVEVPVFVEGTPKGAAVAFVDIQELKVRADVANLPEKIVVNVDGLTDGSKVFAKDVVLPEGVVLDIEDPEESVVTVEVPEDAAPEEVAPAADAAAAPAADAE